MSNSAYTNAHAIFCEISNLEHAIALLEWDESTMMPSGSSPQRTSALSQLQVMLHERNTSAALGSLLDSANADESSLTDPWQRANLREMRRRYEHETALSADLVKARTEATLESQHAWRSLRDQNDWKSFIPYQERVFKLTREMAQVLGEKKHMSPYDALLDYYEPDLREQTVINAFKPLRDELPSLIVAAEEKSRSTRVATLAMKYEQAAQKKLGLSVMQALGFDFERGRLDESHHPFCGGPEGDTRITTRYSEKEFTQALMGIIHETGHALYQQGLPAERLLEPVGRALGMAMHESQSLFWEMQIGRSKPFVRFLRPLILKAFGVDGTAETWTEAGILKQLNRVERSYIRVEADECTYPMHVILRFELEQQLIQGTLAIKDLPEAWNEKMQKYLGLSTLGNDKNGCMQDVHWPVGLIGYFPSYTLGAMTAAQLKGAATKDGALRDEDIAQGNFKPILNWLREKIHKKGRLQTGQDLLTEVTGRPLEAKDFLTHLRTRYL